MRRELRLAVAGLRPRPTLALLAWSVPEALPAAVSGVAIAHAVDEFLADRPALGLAWLAGVMLAALAGALGSRQVFLRTGDLVEPFRDDLVRRVVHGALSQGVAGRSDDGAVARLTRQVEIVRDTYAGLIIAVRGFAVTSFGVAVGLLSIAPVAAGLALVPFVLGFGLFLATLGLAARRQDTAVRAEERLARTAGDVLAGVRDVAAAGAERHASAMVAEPIAAQAAAERSLAAVAALRAVCLGIGGWLPLVVLLAAGPWLTRQGLTTGDILGALTYVLFGLQPALQTMIMTLGPSGLRYVVTLGRVLDAAEPAAPRRRRPAPGPVPSTPDGHRLELRDVTFRYGPHAEPVLRDLCLTVDEGEHLAVVGPSGIGKSTLAGLLCGLLRPDRGTVLFGGVPIDRLDTARLAASRMLIPQQAYVFSGAVWENIAYLRPTASARQIERAVAAVGATELVARLGGLDAQLRVADLSAGERQLLALARGYLSTAAVTVLDEATCHLDPAAERRAEEAFAARGGTLVVVAHRVSSALRARRVMVLDGREVAVGDHESLLRSSPLYRALLGHWNAAPADGPAPDRHTDHVPILEGHGS